MKTKIGWLGLFVLYLAGCKEPAGTVAKIPIDSTIWIANGCMDVNDAELLCPYSFIRLFPDGTYAAGALRGYASGRWKHDTAQQLIMVTPGEGSAPSEIAPSQLGIIYHSGHYLNLVMAADLADFDPGTAVYLNMKAATPGTWADPFEPYYQSWRQKPEAPENPEQLKRRVKAYLQFLEAFYAFASHNQLQKPDNGWFPNVMNMESRGSVRVAYNNELEDWYACFYDEAQAIEGYKLISGAFLNLTLAKTEDKNERNRDAIAQILYTLEQ